MSKKVGRWWDGCTILYSDDNSFVRIRAGWWFLGAALMIYMVGALTIPESRKSLDLERPWFMVVQIGVLLIFFILGVLLAQSFSFRADKSKGTFRLTKRWLGIPFKHKTGNLSEIEYVIIKERIVENSEVSGRYLHLYLKLKDEELILCELNSRLNIPEVRQLALFLECPLMHTDKGLFAEGTFERVESIEELSNAERGTRK
ncbi:hypothetical protein ACFL6F_01795 [Planctomycetota bacterium]